MAFADTHRCLRRPASCKSLLLAGAFWVQTRNPLPLTLELHDVPLLEMNGEKLATAKQQMLHQQPSFHHHHLLAAEAADATPLLDRHWSPNVAAALQHWLGWQ